MNTVHFNFRLHLCFEIPGSHQFHLLEDFYYYELFVLHYAVVVEYEIEAVEHYAVADESSLLR